ncbi:dihydropteroate synthase [Loktanella sp. DSM 29012]|uniref:dihydropteroate synthase n=1 Tax=Loktanella sp. DSM 29012 TaxID=1881056 RepID=UPI0008C3EE6F|nr:dihydropteroate synthase [Loktanella sp. DSM 29012]SEQ57022.1 dihydropteroate synthase [Loktanella sp. DSM 29012]
MNGLLRPLPLPAARHPDDAVPLAGSAAFRFRQVSDAQGVSHPLTALDPAQLHRLSAPRATICGLTLDRPRIMGILNVTPDSFSDGGTLGDVAAAVARAADMARDADILDIGGESTRPGAAYVTPEDEIARTVPVIRAIRAAGITTPISIDTRKAAVAAAALDAGADMVNDVTALRFDPDMAQVVAQAQCPVFLMHSKGDPETMQNGPTYEDVTAEVFDHLAGSIARAMDAGIARHMIITDPGIGFGKTLDHNLTLLRDLAVFHDLGLPILLGASRKRFIGTITGVDQADQRLPGSLAVALHGVALGVQVLRVHDARQTREAIDMALALNGVSHER